MDSLRAALYDEAASIPPLGDIDRAILKVSTYRRRWAGAIAVAVVALIAILGPWKAPALHVEPAVPEPIAPAVELLEVGRPMDTIVQSPLPNGADVAVAGQSPGRAVVWSQEQPREVVSSFRVYGAWLSPDGRRLAHSETNDILVITDLTTGEELLRWRMITDSGDWAQAAGGVWSADSRTLFQQIVATEGSRSPAELRVWQADETGAYRAAGKPIPLPGALVGASPDGATVLADDGGMLTQLTISSSTWVPLGVPSSPPGVAPVERFDGNYGQGCWSPDERYVCWVGRQFVGSTRWQVGWMDLASGSATWTVQELGSPEWARFLGWRGTDPVVVLMEPGRVTVTPRHPQVWRCCEPSRSAPPWIPTSPIP